MKFAETRDGIKQGQYIWQTIYTKKDLGERDKTQTIWTKKGCSENTLDSFYLVY